jgi:hypothetical protein
MAIVILAIGLVSLILARPPVHPSIRENPSISGLKAPHQSIRSIHNGGKMHIEVHSIAFRVASFHITWKPATTHN